MRRSLMAAAMGGLLLLSALVVLELPRTQAQEPRTLVILATAGIRFVPDLIYVEPGEEVKLAFLVTGLATHTHTLFAEVNASVPFENEALQDYYTTHPTLLDIPLPPGTEDEVVFTAPVVQGTYVFVCMTPNHAEVGMHGRMIVAPNEPPNPAFAITPAVGDTTTTFTMDASNSTDLHDPLFWLEVRWDWEDDGVWDTMFGTEKVALHRYITPDDYTIRLEVRDRHGVVNDTTKPVMVSTPDTVPPTIEHTPPLPVLVGQPINVSAVVEDDRGVAEVTLFYRAIGAGSLVPVPLEKSGGGGEYDGVIPAQEVNGTVAYYLEAADASGNVAREPSSGELSVEVQAVETPPPEPPPPFDANALLLFAIPPIAIIAALLVYLFVLRKRPPVG